MLLKALKTTTARQTICSEIYASISGVFKALGKVVFSQIVGKHMLLLT